MTVELQVPLREVLEYRLRIQWKLVSQQRLK